MDIPANGFYVHYKHDSTRGPHDHMYEVVGVARNTEDKTFLVLYRPLYENDWFAPALYQARPNEMFMGTIQKDGQVMNRFRKIFDPVLIADLEDARNKLYG